MSALLERCAVSPIDTTALDNQLYADAESLLGYKVPLRQQRHDEADAEFLRAINTLGLSPFTTESVAKYQQKKIEEAVRLMRKGTSYVMGAGIVLSILAAWLCEGGETGLFTVLCGFLGVTGLLFGLIGFLSVVPNMRREYKWVQIPLCEYLRPIPDFAIQTAVDLKRLFPVCVLSISELVFERKVDPFLVVTSPSGRNFYLEVWNEPGFKQQREQ